MDMDYLYGTQDFEMPVVRQPDSLYAKISGTLSPSSVFRLPALTGLDFYGDSQLKKIRYNRR